MSKELQLHGYRGFFKIIVIGEWRASLRRLIIVRRGFNENGKTALPHRLTQ